jgi:hypothetical protein
MADATDQAFLASPESVAMMLATAYVESGCGQAIAQKSRQTGRPNYESGPAFGIWQVECGASQTAQDILLRHVIHRKALREL